MNFPRTFAAMLLTCAVASGAQASPSASGTKHNLPVAKLLAEADAIAGQDRMLRILRNYHCYYVDPAPASFRPSVFDETSFLFGAQVFDDVYYLGYLNLAVYAIDTGEGLVLVDAGGSEAQGQRILDWLEQAGFAATDVKWLILTHEHVDHVGGAALLRERTGAKVAAGAGALSDAKDSLSANLRPVDLVVSRRSILRVGYREIVLLPTPGHTAGTLSVFAPVTAGGSGHMASFWGGKGMRPNLENTLMMLQSVREFTAESDRLGVDAPLNTHGWGDATVSRLIERALAPALPNPFVLTAEQNRANLRLLDICTAAYLASLSPVQQPAGAAP